MPRNRRLCRQTTGKLEGGECRRLLEDKDYYGSPLENGGPLPRSCPGHKGVWPGWSRRCGRCTPASGCGRGGAFGQASSTAAAAGRHDCEDRAARLAREGCRTDQRDAPEVVRNLCRARRFNMTLTWGLSCVVVGREGMDNPRHSPWETVYSRGLGNGKSNSPSALVGTPRDPFTPSFGPWM